MQPSRRALLRRLAVAVVGLPIGGLAGCRVLAPAADAPTSPGAPVEPGELTAAAPPGSASAPAPVAAGATPLATLPPHAATGPATVSGPTPAAAGPPAPPLAPVPTPMSRPRPLRALLTVPYYSQHVGRQNYCLPTAIAMVADRYDRLPGDISGTPDRAPRFVADVAYGLARQRIAALDEAGFSRLWQQLGADPLGGAIWNVFAPNGRDLAAGMSPALAYLVLGFAFGLTPVLGTLDACLVALADDVPSILFGAYGPLRRADGLPPNVGGYTGPHALVLVGIDREHVIANDPLPSDKIRYSGERGHATASARAVRFALASVRQMTRGDGGAPRGDCFMVPPPAPA